MPGVYRFKALAVGIEPSVAFNCGARDGLCKARPFPGGKAERGKPLQEITVEQPGVAHSKAKLSDGAPASSAKRVSQAGVLIWLLVRWVCRLESYVSNHSRRKTGHAQIDCMLCALGMPKLIPCRC